MKQCRSAEGHATQAVSRQIVHEAELLNRLWTVKFPPRLGRQRLVEFDAQRGVIVTKEVPGVLLQVLIMGRYRRNVDRECLRVLYLCGRWLREFQRLPTRPGDEVRLSDFDPVNLADYCQLRLDRLRSLNYRRITEKFVNDVRSSLTRLTAAAPAEDLGLVWTHADYASQNIIWDGHTLTPIDFAVSKLDHPLTDVTYFLHRLEMLRVYFPWKRWPVEAWREAFLRGYGRPDALSSPMYRALMIRHLVCRLSTYWRRKSQRPVEAVHNSWTRWRVRGQLREMVAKS